MSELTLNQHTRLTDAVERDLLRGAMESQQTIKSRALFKQAGAALVRYTRAFSDYVVEVHDTMNRARAASAHYTGSQW